MSELQPKSSHLLWVVACVLSFGIAFTAGREIAFSKVVVILDGEDLTQIAGERYKIPVSLSQPKRGPDDALVTIVEWCDLRGPACRESNRVVKALQAEYGDELRYVYRHYPEEASENATRAHEFAHMAFEQFGKFWDLREILLKKDAAPSAEELDAIGAHLGVNLKSAHADLERHAHAGYVASDGMFAARFGVTRAPTLFVNGTRLLGAPTESRLRALIEHELGDARDLAESGVSRAELYDEITSDGLWEYKRTELAKNN